MAFKKKIKKNVAAKKATRPSAPEKAAPGPPPGTKPVTVFLHKSLIGRVNLACSALDKSRSEVIRECLEDWLKDKKKAIMKLVDTGLAGGDDEDENEEEDVEEEETEEEDEEEEESDDEEEEEDDA